MGARTYLDPPTPTIRALLGEGFGEHGQGEQGPPGEAGPPGADGTGTTPQYSTFDPSGDHSFLSQGSGTFVLLSALGIRGTTEETSDGPGGAHVVALDAHLNFTDGTAGEAGQAIVLDLVAMTGLVFGTAFDPPEAIKGEWYGVIAGQEAAGLLVFPAFPTSTTAHLCDMAGLPITDALQPNDFIDFNLAALMWVD